MHKNVIASVCVRVRSIVRTMCAFTYVSCRIFFPWRQIDD